MTLRAYTTCLCRPLPRSGSRGLSRPRSGAPAAAPASAGLGVALDGGRIVRDLAWRRSGSERTGWRIASQTGRITGIVVIVIGIYLLLPNGDVTGAMVALTGWF